MYVPLWTGWTEHVTLFSFFLKSSQEVAEVTCPMGAQAVNYGVKLFNTSWTTQKG
jgi:hypothetical protein